MLLAAAQGHFELVKLQERAAELAQTPQFDIAAHYDVMAELDADVHEDTQLAQTEVDAALRLMDKVPQSVFLPCFGTGRHIEALLRAGVSRVVGVDLSPACVAKAQERFAGNSRVELYVGDLRTWDDCGEKFDAAVLLGNSYADIIHPKLLAEVTAGMVRPLKDRGVFVMDYIGRGYLSRCRTGKATVWRAMLGGVPVQDRRTPTYDRTSHVMTIYVQVVTGENGTAQTVWTGFYQKLILHPDEVRRLFAEAKVVVQSVGPATRVNAAYYRGHKGELGMIAKSTWWKGVKVGS